MSAVKSTADFCRYTVSVNSGRFVTDPVRLGALFREYADIERTPDLRQTVELVSSLGIKIQVEEYLETGGVNMFAQGSWHIHYSAKDKPATQKFDILHELFEVIHKNFNTLYPDYHVIKEPYLSRYADRFAAEALIPQRFFLNRLIETGCDLVKLGEGLELSHQCLLVAMRQHLGDIPFVGALYEYLPQNGIRSRLKAHDYVATMVVKTAPARLIQEVCRCQSEPVLNERPNGGSLVCAAFQGSYPIFYHSKGNKDSVTVLIRPIFSGGQRPSRAIFLALPNTKSDRFFPQVDLIQSVIVNEDSPCPSAFKCRNSHNCRWKR